MSQVELQVVKYPLVYGEGESIQKFPALGFIVGTRKNVSIVIDVEHQRVYSRKHNGSLEIYPDPLPEAVSMLWDRIDQYNYLEVNNEKSGESLVIKDPSGYYARILSPDNAIAYGKFFGINQDGQDQWEKVEHFDKLPQSAQDLLDRLDGLLPLPLFSITHFAQFQRDKHFPRGFHHIQFSLYTKEAYDEYSISYDGENCQYTQNKRSKDSKQTENKNWLCLKQSESWGENTIKSQSELLATIRNGLHYQPATFSHKESRWHLFSVTSKYHKRLRGDVLKTTILARVSSFLDNRKNFLSVDEKVGYIKSSGEYAILAKSQGLATRILGIFGKKTSSVKAFDKLVEEARARETMMRR